MLFIRAIFTMYTKVDKEVVKWKFQGGEVVFFSAVIWGIIYFAAYHLEIFPNSSYKITFAFLNQNQNEGIVRIIHRAKTDYIDMVKEGRTHEFDMAKVVKAWEADIKRWRKAQFN